MNSHFSRLIINSPGQIALENFALSNLQPGWEIVQPIYTGLCGSDIALFMGKHPFRRFPVRPGHECVVQSKSGDLFIVNPLISCGTCGHCRNGKPMNCSEMRMLGFGHAGGFSEAMSVPSRNLMPLPVKLNPFAAVLTEPLAVAVHLLHLVCVTGAGPRNLIIYGGGPIALLIAVLAKKQGHRVRMVEPGKRRASLAEQIGVKNIADPAEEGVTELIKEFLIGDGIAIDTTGHPEALEWLFKVTRRGGTIFTVGTITREAVFQPWKLSDKGLTLQASILYTFDDLSEAADLLLRDLAFVGNIVTHRPALSHMPDFLKNLADVPILGKVVARIKDV